MPRVKDLGIKVIPETMRPLEAGGGAGCGVSCIGTQCGCSLRICTVLFTHPWCWWPSNQTCWCSFVSPVQQFQACQLGTQGGCGPGTPVAGTIDTTIVQQPVAELTRESISALKEQLQQQIAKLDEHAKTLKK